MLISFSFESWGCFGDSVNFTMMATKVRGQRETLATWGRNKILPVAALYGENAAGKSSFIKALAFVQELVLHDVGPSAPLPVNPCRSKPGKEGAPSYFSLTFLAKGKAYRLTFRVTMKGIVDERLEILNTRGQITDTLYEREGETVTIKAKKASEQLQLATRATVPQRLFLSVAAQLNAQEAMPAFLWFAETLLLLKPGARLTRLDALCGGRFEQKTNDFLNRFAAGTKRLSLRDVSFERLQLDENSRRIAQNVRANETLILRMGQESSEATECFVFTRGEDGIVNARRLFFVHEDEEGHDFDLPMSLESDGTLRMVNLIPALQMLETEGEERVLVVDELDRSLHPHVCRGMIEDFLATRGPSGRSQLIFSTHNTQLIADKTIRKDEYWIVDKACALGSAVYSFSDFQGLREQSDYLRAYTEGRMGGIPKGF